VIAPSGAFCSSTAGPPSAMCTSRKRPRQRGVMTSWVPARLLDQGQLAPGQSPRVRTTCGRRTVARLTWVQSGASISWEPTTGMSTSSTVAWLPRESNEWRAMPGELLNIKGVVAAGDCPAVAASGWRLWPLPSRPIYPRPGRRSPKAVSSSARICRRRSRCLFYRPGHRRLG
jgi:hypothetical protein